MSKLYVLSNRLQDVIRMLPLRLLRLGQHVWLGLRWKHPPQSTSDSQRTVGLLRRIAVFWIEGLIHVLECLGIGEMYETMTDLVKWKTRPLTAEEIALARVIFGDSIRYKRVRIDEYAFLGPRQKRFCYVSFYVINSWGEMPPATLIHELTHVWQYQQIGAVYMPRAIAAQYTEAGYNYGGVANLRAYLQKEQDLLAFNLEQQADIVEDYFRIQKGIRPSWGNGDKSDLWVYKKIMRPVLHSA